MTSRGFDCRVAFAETLMSLAEADPRVVAVVNDSIGSSNLKEFAQRFPDRLVNVGIAEQNMIGVSAGLAAAGKMPFTCGASCFLTGRALEQIKADSATLHSSLSEVLMAQDLQDLTGQVIRRVITMVTEVEGNLEIGRAHV
mgnify:CR=1 FL=1